MSMKMKGLLKGLRYISTIFDEEETETEMQIGFPTDVKHVAHIGWDGPTANSPSWINQFKDGESEGGGGATPNGKEIDQQNAPKTRDQRVPAQEKRASTGSDQVLDSPSRRKPKGSRHASSASASASASGTESPRNSTSTTEGGDPTLGAGPKRRKKPKGSSSGGPSSSRTSNKSKPTGPSSTDVSHYSDPGIGRRRLKGKETSCQGSVMKTSEQEDQKALDDISRGIQAM